MDLLIILLIKALDIYLWLIIASVVVSWLVVFEVLNLRNKFIYKAYTLLNRIVNPAIEQLRRVIPPFGSIDFTPMILMFAIIMLQHLLVGLLQ